MCTLLWSVDATPVLLHDNVNMPVIEVETT